MVELTGERDFVFYVIAMISGMSFIICLDVPFFKKLDNSLFLEIILFDQILDRKGSVV